jgi:hypothetical protein
MLQLRGHGGFEEEALLELRVAIATVTSRVQRLDGHETP